MRFHSTISLLLFEKNNDWNESWGFEKTSQTEFRSISHEDLMKMSGLTKEKLDEIDLRITDSKDQIFDGVAFEELAISTPIVGLIAKVFKVRSCITISFPTALKGDFSITVYSKKQSIYFPQHAEALQKLSSTIPTVDR